MNVEEDERKRGRQKSEKLYFPSVKFQKFSFQFSSCILRLDSVNSVNRAGAVGEALTPPPP